MIATHNIKVNGRWIHAGESYETQEQLSMLEGAETGKASTEPKAARTKAEAAGEETVKAVEAKATKAEKPVEKPAKTTRRKKA